MQPEELPGKNLRYLVLKGEKDSSKYRKQEKDNELNINKGWELSKEVNMKEVREWKVRIEAEAEEKKWAPDI